MRTMLFFLFFGTAAAYEWGAEFTLTNNEMWEDFITARRNNRPTIDTPTALKNHHEMLQAIKKECPQCQLLDGETCTWKKCRIKLPSGRITLDLTLDQAVIEFKLYTAKIEDIEAEKDLIQKLIFDIGESLSLRPDLSSKQTGGGHLTLFFDADLEPRLIKNFHIDFSNHPALSEGVLGQDLHNAKPLSQLSLDQQKAYRETIEKFDRKYLEFLEKLESAQKETPGTPSFLYALQNINHRPDIRQDFLNPIHDKVYLGEGKRRAQTKHHALMDSEYGLEIRSPRPQASIDEFLSQIKTLSSRLDLLKDHPFNLSFSPSRAQTYLEKQEQWKSYQNGTIPASTKASAERISLRESRLVGDLNQKTASYHKTGLSKETLEARLIVIDRLLPFSEKVSALDELVEVLVKKYSLDRLATVLANIELTKLSRVHFIIETRHRDIYEQARSLRASGVACLSNLLD